MGRVWKGRGGGLGFCQDGQWESDAWNKSGPGMGPGWGGIVRWTGKSLGGFMVVIFCDGGIVLVTVGIGGWWEGECNEEWLRVYYEMLGFDEI